MKQKFLKMCRCFGTHIKQFQPELLSAYAASTTLFLLITFFPFLILLLGGLRYLPFSASYFETIGLDFIPTEIKELILAIIREITEYPAGAYLPFVAVAALLSASSAFSSLTQGFNTICNCRETRNFLLTRILGVLYTILFMIMLILSLIVLVFWNGILQWIGETLPFTVPILKIIGQFRIIGTLLILTMFFAMIYKIAPNKKKKLLYELPGAALAATSWIIFSYIYSLYISSMSGGSAIYGSLSALVFMIIWMFACILILFIGAYINEQLLKKKQSPSAT